MIINIASAVNKIAYLFKGQVSREGDKAVVIEYHVVYETTKSGQGVHVTRLQYLS